MHDAYLEVHHKADAMESMIDKLEEEHKLSISRAEQREADEGKPSSLIIQILYFLTFIPSFIDLQKKRHIVWQLTDCLLILRSCP